MKKSCFYCDWWADGNCMFLGTSIEKNPDDTCVEFSSDPLVGWQSAEIAPKDGTVILGVFKDLPPGVHACVWQKHSNEWCISVLQAGLFHSEWDDFYFENMYSPQLIKWMPMPEA